MCSLEVPDIEQAIAADYTDEDVDVWLVDAGDDYTAAWGFISDSSTSLPVLLDTTETVYRSYGALGDAYAPFPLQVVIDRDGVITYLATQYDASAVKDAIDEALAR